MSRETAPFLTRRLVLRFAGTMAGACLLPAARSFAAGDLTGRLAAYMVGSRDRALPDRVLLDAKHRILDTVAAMVSGSALPS